MAITVRRGGSGGGGGSSAPPAFPSGGEYTPVAGETNPYPLYDLVEGGPETYTVLQVPGLSGPALGIQRDGWDDAPVLVLSPDPYIGLYVGDGVNDAVNDTVEAKSVEIRKHSNGLVVRAWGDGSRLWLNAERVEISRGVLSMLDTVTETPYDLSVTDGAVQFNGAPLVDADLTAIGALTPTDNDVLQRKSGAWTNRTPAQLRSDMSAQPLDDDLTAIAALTPTNNDVLQRKSGAWTNRTPAQLATDMGLSGPTFLSTFKWGVD